MLILARKVNESIVIVDPTSGLVTTVYIKCITGNRVSIAIDADRATRVHRGENVAIRRDNSGRSIVESV